MVDAALFSSNASTWRTPAIVARPLIEEFDLQIDAAADDKSALLDCYITPEMDFFKTSMANTRYWINPPWGRNTKPDLRAWCQRFYEDARDRGCTVVALLPARPDTRWFHQYVLNKADIRFIKGRVTFDDPITGEPAPSAAPFPVMIAVWHPCLADGRPVAFEPEVTSWDPYNKGRKAA